MTSLIANKFKNGELHKPVLKKETFYIGGFPAMIKKLNAALVHTPGAYNEFRARTEDLSTADASLIIFDYICVE